LPRETIHAILAPAPMHPQFLRRLVLAALACCLLDACGSDFHLVIFNDTDDTIVIRRRASEPSPLFVLAGISGEITGVSTDDFTIERQGRLLHYHFPLAYTFPSAAVPSGYKRSVRDVGRSYYFQFTNDNRIYILRQNEPLRSSDHPQQPPGFPLVPVS
jgi:hypothetical protein